MFGQTSLPFFISADLKPRFSFLFPNHLQTQLMKKRHMILVASEEELHLPRAQPNKQRLKPPQTPANQLFSQKQEEDDGAARLEALRWDMWPAGSEASGEDEETSASAATR